VSERTRQRWSISQLALMRNFFVTTKTGNILIGGETMGKGIAVDEGSHEAKKRPARS
jgi:hypothetical protein